MTVFRVKAGTPDGRVLSRELEAASEEDAGQRLEKEGLFPIDVRPRGGVRSLFSLPGRPAAGFRDFLVFNQGFITLLKAGVPVLDSLDVLRRGCKSQRLAAAIGDAAEEIKNGSSIAESMMKHSEQFPAIYTSTISAGEKTGDLVPSISGYVEYQKRIEALRKKIVSAAMYPLALSGVSAVVIVFLLSYVVPSFAKIYLDSGAALPLPTLALLGATGFLKRHFVFIAAALLAGGFALRAYFNGSAGRRVLDRLKLSTPQLGEIYRGYAAAKFSRTLGMILKSGIPLVQALSMSKGVLGNAVLFEKLDRVIKKASEGAAVTRAIAEEGLLPDVALSMFGVGEKTASLPAILDDVAEFLEQDVNHKVGLITGLVEPALMVIMGLVVGAVVILMYLPIFQMGARI